MVAAPMSIFDMALTTPHVGCSYVAITEFMYVYV